MQLRCYSALPLRCCLLPRVLLQALAMAAGRLFAVKLVVLTSIVASATADILWADVCTQVRAACSYSAKFCVLCAQLQQSRLALSLSY